MGPTGYGKNGAQEPQENPGSEVISKNVMYKFNLIYRFVYKEKLINTFDLV